MPEASIDFITDIAMGFMASNALITAVELDVFSVIGDRPQTSDVIARSVGVDDENKTFIYLLDGLVALGVLEREGDAEDAHYTNSSASGAFLNKVSDHDIGGALLLRNKYSTDNWRTYTKQLRSKGHKAEAAARFKEHGAKLSQRPNEFASVYQCMSAFEAEDYRSLAKIFDFSAYSNLLDINSGIARLPVEFGRHHPHLQFIAFDHPKIIALARDYIETHQMHFRVSTATGNLLTDTLPAADVAMLSHVLRKLSESEKETALKKAYDAVPEDGAVIVLDIFSDDLRRKKWYPLLLSIQLQLEFGKGGCMTPSQLERMGKRIGFNRFEFEEISHNAVAAFLYK